LKIFDEFKILSKSHEEILESTKDFFQKSEKLTFEDFQLKSKDNSSFLEGFGLFQYFFLPLFQPIEKFLSTENYFEKTGSLWWIINHHRIHIT
jgi:hypothetical protein